MLLTGACVVTMDDAGTEHRDGWVLVAEGRIAAVGGGAPPAAGERVDLGGAVVTPGLVNTHHHLYQTLTRAQAQEADLFTWLKTLYPVWAGIDAESLYAAARTGLAELALSGCTTVFDHHYVFPRGTSGLIEAELAAADELGVALIASRGSMDLGESQGGLPPDSLVEDLDTILAETERLAAAYPGRVAVAPCSPFSVTGELMRESAELARRFGLVLHTHLAETVEEDAYCRELHGCTPVEYIESLGWLAGDVCGRGGPAAMTARDALRLGTRGGAAVLRLDDRGSLEPGRRADLAVWRTDGLELAGATDPVAGLVLSAPHRVDRLYVGGEEVVRDGRLVRADEEEIARQQRAHARRFAA